MVTEIQNEKPFGEMIQNLKVGPSSKVADSKMVPAKDGSQCDATSCVFATGDATSSTKGSDVDQESVSTEQGMYYPASNYYGYFYPGYDVSFGEWVDQGYILGADRLDLRYPGIQVENESVAYYIPGYGYVQPPLNPYFSPPVVGVDGQFLGQQPYFPSPLFPQVAAPGYLPSPIPYRSEVVPAYSWDPSLLVVGSQINGISGGPVPPSPKSTLSAPNPTSVSAYVKPTQKIMSSTHIEAKASPPSSYLAHSQCGLPVASIHNQSLKAVNKVTLQGAGFQPTAVLAKGYFPITKFPAYSNPSMGGMLYSNCPMGFKTNGQGWAGSEKLKAISKSIGLGDFDLLNEQNRGPRKNNSKDSWISDVDVVGCLGSGDTSQSNNFNVVIRKDQYNLPDLPIKFDQALFFVIKSHSEDAIHKA